MSETLDEMVTRITTLRKELSLTSKRLARAEQDRNRFARALVDLGDRPHGVMRPKWVLDLIASARSLVPTPTADRPAGP